MTERGFPQANLASERLMLRPFRSDDAVDVHAVWNDDAYLRFAPAGLATAAAGPKRAAEWCSSGPIFAVERGADGRLVGHVALFGTDRTRMVTEMAVVDNIASIRVAEAAGFRFEGILRKRCFDSVRRGDFAAYSLIPADLLGVSRAAMYRARRSHR